MSAFDDLRRGVVVVAHPDDESLWAGGLLSRYGARFTVICCSIPRKDPVRAWKFFAACDVFGSSARLLPFTEPGPTEPLDGLALLDLDSFDCIVTHNRDGEYGHRHHRLLSRAIRERWADRTWTFGWRPGASGTVALHLTEREMECRMRALRCYDHVAAADRGTPKWQALLDRYAIDLSVETFDPPGN